MINRECRASATTCEGTRRGTLLCRIDKVRSGTVRKLTSLVAESDSELFDETNRLSRGF